MVVRHIYNLSSCVKPYFCRPLPDGPYRSPQLDTTIGRWRMFVSHHIQDVIASLFSWEPYFATLRFYVSCILWPLTIEITVTITVSVVSSSMIRLGLMNDMLVGILVLSSLSCKPFSALAYQVHDIVVMFTSDMGYFTVL